MIPGSVEAVQLRMELSAAQSSLLSSQRLQVMQIVAVPEGRDLDEAWRLVESSSLSSLTSLNHSTKQQQQQQSATKISEAREVISRALVSSSSRLLSAKNTTSHWDSLTSGQLDPLSIHLYLLPPSMTTGHSIGRDDPAIPVDPSHFNLANPSPVLLRSILDSKKKAAESSSQAFVDPPLNLVMSWEISSPGSRSGSRRGIASIPLGNRSSPTPARLKMILSSSHLPPSISLPTLLQPFRAFATQRQCLSLPVSTKHDFKSNVMCVVPLCLLVRNCSSEVVEILVETGGWASSFSTRGAWVMAANESQPGNEPGSASVQTVHAGLAPSPDYVWCGR